MERILCHSDLPSAQMQLLCRQLKDLRLGLGSTSLLLGEQKCQPFPYMKPFQCRFCQFAVSRRGNAIDDLLAVQPVQQFHDMRFQRQQFPILLCNGICHLLCKLFRCDRQVELLHEIAGEFFNGHSLYRFGQVVRHFFAVVVHDLLVHLPPHAAGIQQRAVQIKTDKPRGSL